MFNDKKLKEELKILKEIIKNMPDESKLKTLESFALTPYNECPETIQEMFLDYYNLARVNNEIGIVAPDPYVQRLSKIGTPKDTLGKLKELYLTEVESKNKLILSCPNCQEVFSLKCTTSEDYAITCKKCGKRLILNVTSNAINVQVKGGRK